MTIFQDRIAAGKALVKALSAYDKAPSTLIVALPRGGVIVGYEVAQALSLPLDIICPRKIGAPFNPELAIGAICETGEGIFSEGLIQQMDISQSYIDERVKKEQKEAIWRLNTYRKDRPPRQLKGKRVILVDDGIATGSTMRAAIVTLRKEHVSQIVMAVPVAPPDTLEKIRDEVDEVICLAAPSAFYAVGQFYEHFDQTTDEEVIALLAKPSSTSSQLRT